MEEWRSIDFTYKIIVRIDLNDYITRDIISDRGTEQQLVSRIIIKPGINTRMQYFFP